jgi:hypothetical protein
VIRPQWFIEAGMPKLGVDLPMSAIVPFAENEDYGVRSIWLCAA